MNASGPALCSPLNGVLPVNPHGAASAGSLNQKPTWNVLVGGRLVAASKPKIWSRRIVLICTVALPDESVSMSDWYQAIPKLVKPGTGVPFACWLLFWTGNRSNARSGLKSCSVTVRVSFRSPRSTFTVAVGVLPVGARQDRNGVLGKRLKPALDGLHDASRPAIASTPTAMAADPRRDRVNRWNMRGSPSGAGPAARTRRPRAAASAPYC